MYCSPQPVIAPPVDRVSTCGMEWGVLDHVASASGVQTLATHGVPSGRTVDQITTFKSVLSNVLHAPRDVAICRRGLSFRPGRQLNFHSPDAGAFSVAPCASSGFAPDEFRRLNLS